MKENKTREAVIVRRSLIGVAANLFLALLKALPGCRFRITADTK